MNRNIIIATEDVISEAVVERIIESSENPWLITVRMKENGNGYLRKKLDGLIRTAKTVPVFLLTDLDRVSCAPDLIRDWVGPRSLPGEMYFRVAVREVEAWLLADHEGLSEFLGIPEIYFPEVPEDLPDPKESLLNIVKRFGSREIKAELLAAPKARAKVGLGYNSSLTAFVREHWDPNRAASRADSLARAICRIS